MTSHSSRKATSTAASPRGVDVDEIVEGLFDAGMRSQPLTDYYRARRAANFTRALSRLRAARVAATLSVKTVLSVSIAEPERHFVWKIRARCPIAPPKAARKRPPSFSQLS